MSESKSTHNVDQLKKAYHQLAFIHQIITQRTQYFLEEVDIAKDAAKTITEMANKLAAEIKSLEAPKEEATQEAPEAEKV